MKLKLIQTTIMVSKYTLYGLIFHALFFNLVLANSGNAQKSVSVREAKVVLNTGEYEVKEIFNRIENNSEFRFAIDKNDLSSELKHLVSIHGGEHTVSDILIQISKESRIKFRQVNNNITVSKLKVRNSQAHEVDVFISMDVEISGQVTDQSGQGLPGATIVVKDGSSGTTTDLDGQFKLNCPEDATLIISFVGYVTQEIKLGNKTSINVEMIEDSEQLSEVVVIGYGTQKKRDLTGAIGVVDGDEIAARRVTNVSNALQGAVPGVTVTRSSSAPGSGNNVLIRGITTLQGESSPLILVDNVPVSSMNDVNPDNVASISVLKDGASAAIYGSRAAAGVIIITTKRAETNDFNITYSGEVISNVPTEFRSTVGAIRYMELNNEKQWNDNGNGADEYPVWSQDLIDNYKSNSVADPDQFPNTNWRDLVLKSSAIGHRHNLLMSGGTKQLKTLASFGYEYQDALYDHRNWQRYIARVNNDLKINDKFGATINMALRITDDNQPIVDPTKRAIESAPIYAALWQDGRIAEGKTGDNIYARLNHGGSRDLDSYLVYGKVELYVKPIEDLKISFNLAPNIEFQKFKAFNKAIPYWAADDPNRSENPSYILGHNISQITLDESRINNNSLTSQVLLNYDKYFGDHSLNITAGYEEFSSKSEALRVRSVEFTSNDYPYLSQAPVDKVFDDGTSILENAYISSFARLGYNFSSKYYLQATARRDGSSRFAPDYRWGLFPSVAAGWILSNEKFMQSVNTISFAKLRASYGQLGNDRLGNYLYQTVLQFSNVYLANGSDVDAVRSAAQLYLAVEDITWETTSTLNIGFDLGLIDDKLSTAFDYFQKETTDMLLDLSIPSLSGYNDPTVNVGSMSTKGWEFSATWNDNIGDFQYSTSFNFFDSRSIIGNVNKKRLFSNGGNFLSEEGIEFQSWYGYKSDGLYQTQEEVDNSAVTSASVSPGDVKYKDLSGPDGVPDGVINELDKVVLGGSQPRMQYGGNINLSYKGFDFGVIIQGVGKRNYYLSSAFTQPFQESWLSPPSLLEGNYWSVYNTNEQNSDARYPRYAETSRDNNYSFSDFWLINGSYFRVKNISLGYTIPSDIIEKIGMRNIRVYIAGNDLFTINDLPSGIDPEGGTGYLITKSFIAGIKIGF